MAQELVGLSTGLEIARRYRQGPGIRGPSIECQSSDRVPSPFVRFSHRRRGALSQSCSGFISDAASADVKSCVWEARFRGSGPSVPGVDILSGQLTGKKGTLAKSSSLRLRSPKSSLLPAATRFDPA